MSKTHTCYNGKQFTDSSRTTMMPCPECQAERKLDARDGVLDEETGKTISFSEKLGINQRYISDVYSYEHIIGKADSYYLDKNSLGEFNTYVDKLISSLIVGRLPKTSLVLYLGRHAKLQEFAYILLASAYKGILTVSKVLTARQIKINKHLSDFDENYTSDLAVVILTSDSDHSMIDEVQGFMQERAYNQKPTIILLSNRKNFMYTLGRICSLDDERLDLGAYLGVSYKKDLNMSEENVLIARKAYEVSNTTLGTSQELEDRYRNPESVDMEPLKGDMKELDINSLRGSGTFNGRG